ncbi:fucose 4-O-acetylase-like acetyltransferase [Bacillus mesophilus]|nr:fucose 4-O-acetylase-like acetyltransferase [Bacillus mesophilus]
MMISRDAYYDNAKFLLIFLVVFGHLIQSYIEESKVILTLYHTIYVFHMPAFILISGFFAKGFKQTGYLQKVAKKLIIPYLIFQGIYSFFYYVIQGKDLTSLNPLDPHWSLWFLISLFFWNVMLYVFTKLSPLTAIGSAIMLGVLIGYINEVNGFLSLSRTFVFFPLFLVGFYLSKEHFQKMKVIRIKIAGLLILLCTFIMFFFLPDFNYQWLFGSKPYEMLGAFGVNGPVIRLSIYVLSFLTTLSFLALVPLRRLFFTKWGTSTIYVYLLHGFFIKSFRNSQFVDVINRT